ncbi:2-oxoglutarate-dependent dioxygenase DAO [Sesamum alatum]|uniref:2-oxoglutarate-dependent dioxygenase DAO n=1 Tax=Sesamum alatum TaxID=300844 RepID=A0AAE1XYW8_9LAMI|nr:2-oxoglutarate-dependent dioxygenase DAO [Sesamum alatum]
MATKCIPVIDMQQLSTLPEKIVKAAEEWGCFRLVNHSVPVALMSEMKAVTQSLFDLPLEIKTRNFHPQLDKGYIPPKMVTLSFESLCLCDVMTPGSVDDFCAQLDASPHQREIIHKYCVAVYDVAQLMGSKLMEGVRARLGGEVFKRYGCQIKLNKYNFRQERIGETGGVMHTDDGFITVLQDDEMVSGLEVVDKITGQLVSVDPMPGALLINIGDIGMVWSNGRFYNVKHRVQCYEPTDRISISFFVLAPKDEKVEAPAELVDPDHPRRYLPFDFEEYRKLRVSTRSGSGEALELFSTKNS